MKRLDTVFYGVGAATVRARVETLHRDGTVTVGAQFFVDAEGKDVPGYLGYRFSRVERSDLRPSYHPDVVSRRSEPAKATS